MTLYDPSRPRLPSAAFPFRIGLGFASVLGSLAAWNDGRETRRALSRLSDRELEDIGLCRADIIELAERGRR